MISIGDYLERNRNKTLGGGECAHAATEALRVAGWAFDRIGADNPNAGDYVWGQCICYYGYEGTKLQWQIVKGLPVARGDIIQYRNIYINTGHGTQSASHHTSIVRTVDPKTNLPIEVYEQNVNGRQFIQVDAINFGGLKSGWFRIYRAVRRSLRAGEFQFTVANWTGAPVTIQLKYQRQPTWSYNFSLGVSSVQKYQTISASGSQYSPYFHVGNENFLVNDAAGYILYGSPNSPTVYRI